MTKKLLTVLAFALALAAGTVAAAAIAGQGPTSVQQTVSSTASTTGTTATTATSTTTTTTTTTPSKKITICHHVFRAKSTKHVTIKISRSAWPAHQKHGDSIGACNTAAAKKFHSRAAHVRKFHHGRRGR